MDLFYGFVSIDAKTLQTTATSAMVCKVKPKSGIRTLWFHSL